MCCTHGGHKSMESLEIILCGNYNLTLIPPVEFSNEKFQKKFTQSRWCRSAIADDCASCWYLSCWTAMEYSFDHLTSNQCLPSSVKGNLTGCKGVICLVDPMIMWTTQTVTQTWVAGTPCSTPCLTQVLLQMQMFALLVISGSLDHRGMLPTPHL
jgi:hypothetical protein